jgi:uncharacterized protein YndB with AHSA1/START domain
VRLAHRTRTSATPAQVWQVLGHPARWPEFSLYVRTVRGTHGEAAAGQALVGVSRVGSLSIPIDVLEAEPGSRLVLLVHTAPGVRERVVHEIIPVVSGGSDVRVSMVVEGLFARLSAVPLWLGTGVTARLLAVRAERIARAAKRVA